MVKLIRAVAEEQETVGKSMMTARNEDERSYGPFAARRCDVYVVSFGSGLLDARLDIVKELWKNGIRADLVRD
jgi:translation initiation factor 2-alpha kinase 4